MFGFGAPPPIDELARPRRAGEAVAAAVLLPPLSYQALTEDDVFGLYEDVARNLSVPLIVYDNPGTTHFTFTEELYGRIAELPHVASIKIPGVPTDPAAAAERIAGIRRRIPAHVTIGVSGDAHAADGLIAGCDAWYSVIGGTLPSPALVIARAALTGDAEVAIAESKRLNPLWALFARHGSVRVVAAIAEHYGPAARSSLPLPLRGLNDTARAETIAVIERLGLRPRP